MPLRHHVCFPLIVLFLLAPGCAPPPESAAPLDPRAARVGQIAVEDSLVQYSLLAALAAGDYSSGPKLREILKEGDFGVGTFDRLDGELILVDGRIYQGLADGAVRPADLDLTTPFVAVTFFDEDGRIENLAAKTLEEMDAHLDRELPRPNAPYAIRIDGAFKSLTLRSVPAQSPPFKPLVEVVKTQTTWRIENVKGTLIGFRCPTWVGTLNVPGYHWHFLSDDRQVGGHLLGCEFEGALLRYDECKSILIHIPEPGEFDKFSTEKVDKQDINKIERQRTDKK